MCDKMEVECKLYTVKYFQGGMHKLGDGALRLTERYGKFLKVDHTHQAGLYPTIDGIGDFGNYHVPDLLELFVAEVIKP